MYFLDCNYTLKPIIKLIGIVINIIQIGIPIILIILGSIDLGKAVISSKDDEVKKAQKAFLRRLMYAVAVFLVVWIVKLVLGYVPKIFSDKDVSNTTAWESCWGCIVGNDNCKWVNIDGKTVDENGNVIG